MSIVRTVIVLCALGQIGIEAELTVYLEEIKINEMNPEYVDVANTEAYIDEDSSGVDTITMNFTTLKKLPDEAEGRFQLFGLSMGRYNIPTGVDFGMRLCEMINEPILMGPILAVLGLTPQTCPPEPGTYYHDGYKIPMENLPDDFPDNKYKAVLGIFIEEIPVVRVDIFLETQT